MLDCAPVMRDRVGHFLVASAESMSARLGELAFKFNCQMWGYVPIRRGVWLRRHRSIFADG
jgi:hypothetical protein